MPKSPKKGISSTTPIKASPLSKQIFKEEDVELEEPAETTTSPIPGAQEPEEKSAAELRAAKISDRQITSYWNKQERDRKSKRVHQEDLTLSEKVLRYFDVSNQYGVSEILPGAILRLRPQEANLDVAMRGHIANETLAAG